MVLSEYLLSVSRSLSNHRAFRDILGWFSLLPRVSYDFILGDRERGLPLLDSKKYYCSM